MNFRNSRQRQKILEALKGTRLHPAAEWVYKKLKDEIPGLSLGTVYRNLAVLEKMGFVRKLTFGSTRDRFDATIAPHHHLVCERCGLIEDLTIPLLADIDTAAEKKSDFKVSRHRIEFFGLCGKCRKTDKTTKRNKR